MSYLPMTYLTVALGSALGGMARHWLIGVVSTRFPTAFPWSTLLVNVSGSFLIGVAAVLLAPPSRWNSVAARDLVIVGMLGGYTTFSAFSLQTLQLLRQQKWWLACLNASGSVVLCLLAVFAGYLLASNLQKS
jgi:fluoride exporter